MTKGKTFLLGGVILVVASGSWAGQRTRGGESVRGGGAGSVAAPVARELAPGVAAKTVNGVTTTVNSRNNIGLDDVIAQYGSVEQYYAAVITGGTLSAPGHDGEAILANNMIGLVPGFASPSMLPKTLASRQLEARHGTTTVGGVDVVVFADGMVSMDSDPRVAQAPSGVPAIPTGDGVIYASGNVQY